MRETRPLTNYDLYYYAKKLKIKYFRGVYMLDELPRNGPKKFETAIVNLDSSRGAGTHWVAYLKRGDCVLYFDSFGNLKPPKQLVRYFKQVQIYYNYETIQKYNTNICGHLCLDLLRKLSQRLFRNAVRSSWAGTRT